MKESARAALSWFRATCCGVRDDPIFFKNAEIDLHVPSGAIPKDGPSAGVTIATALASELTQRPVRGDIAMTGEVTLSGRVLPVGGIKREGPRRAPRRYSRGDPAEAEREERERGYLSKELKRDLTIHFVQTVDEVLLLALLPAVKTRTDRKTGRKVQASPAIQPRSLGAGRLREHREPCKRFEVDHFSLLRPCAEAPRALNGRASMSSSSS